VLRDNEEIRQIGRAEHEKKGTESPLVAPLSGELGVGDGGVEVLAGLARVYLQMLCKSKGVGGGGGGGGCVCARAGLCGRCRSSRAPIWMRRGSRSLQHSTCAPCKLPVRDGS
jgi:hypothetical protein